MPKIRLLLILFVVLTFLTTAKAESAEYYFDYQKIVNVEEAVLLDLSLVQGNVTISGNSDNRIIIEAVKTIRASNKDEAEEVADHIEIKVSPDKKKVTIETYYLKMTNRSKSFWSKFLGSGNTESFGRVDYTISVPIRTSLIINSNESIIDISSLEGDINITNAAGSIRSEYIFGNITLSQPVGKIELNWIEGDIRIKSNAAKISIKQLRGAIDIATFSGEVNIETELDSPRDYYVETTSGKINLLIPNTATGQLQIQTETGNISSEIPIVIKSVSRRKLVGSIGQGGPSIKIVSTSGDVSVKQF